MMISVDKALEIILSSIPLIKESERVTLFEAFGRVLAEDITAPANVPPENNSAMDGYAVIHADISSAEAPSFKLKVDEEIRAGQNNEGKLLKSGYAIRIMTGAPLPEGADVVVPFEDTDEKNGIVTIAAHLRNMIISGLPVRI